MYYQVAQTEEEWATNPIFSEKKPLEVVLSLKEAKADLVSAHVSVEHAIILHFEHTVEVKAAPGPQPRKRMIFDEQLNVIVPRRQFFRTELSRTTHNMSGTPPIPRPLPSDIHGHPPDPHSYSGYDVHRNVTTHSSASSSTLVSSNASFHQTTSSLIPDKELSPTASGPTAAFIPSASSTTSLADATLTIPLRIVHASHPDDDAMIAIAPVSVDGKGTHSGSSSPSPHPRTATPSIAPSAITPSVMTSIAGATFNSSRRGSLGGGIGPQPAAWASDAASIVSRRTTATTMSGGRRSGRVPVGAGADERSIMTSIAGGGSLYRTTTGGTAAGGAIVAGGGSEVGAGGATGLLRSGTTSTHAMMIGHAPAGMGNYAGSVASFLAGAAAAAGVGPSSSSRVMPAAEEDVEEEVVVHEPVETPYVCLSGYEPTGTCKDGDELTMRPGDHVIVSDVFEDGWAIGTNLNTSTAGFFLTGLVRFNRGLNAGGIGITVAGEHAEAIVAGAGDYQDSGVQMAQVQPQTGFGVGMPAPIQNPGGPPSMPAKAMVVAAQSSAMAAPGDIPATASMGGVPAIPAAVSTKEEVPVAPVAMGDERVAMLQAQIEQMRVMMEAMQASLRLATGGGGSAPGAPPT
ncbi:hypothetical protein HK101_004558 [Irineochytrium annulatum]|nr:hypothetical protein HK101_004558 [Irineochytrium annulatum]